MTVNKKEKKDVVYFTFPILEQEGIVHGCSSRLGGVSTGVCTSMNLGFNCDDEKENIFENHRRFAEAVGYDEHQLVFCNQIHEAEIRRVYKEDCGKGIFKESDILGIDGLVTNDPDVVLMTFFADCVPLFFYDKRNRAVAAVHSGWRGTVKKIGAAALRKMQEEFGTHPSDVVVGIGPSICKDCYEVSKDVIDEFCAVFDEKYWNDIFASKPDGKYQLDLWKANEIILQEAGVPKEQIQIGELCTCCNPNLLFSHRASHGRRGSLAGAITLGGRHAETELSE